MTLSHFSRCGMICELEQQQVLIRIKYEEKSESD